MDLPLPCQAQVPSSGAHPTSPGRNTGLGAFGEWMLLGRRDGGKEKGMPVGSHMCAAFMKRKGIDGGIVAELTDCMKN